MIGRMIPVRWRLPSELAEGPYVGFFKKRKKIDVEKLSPAALERRPTLKQQKDALTARISESTRTVASRHARILLCPFTDQRRFGCPVRASSRLADYGRSSGHRGRHYRFSAVSVWLHQCRKSAAARRPTLSRGLVPKIANELFLSQTVFCIYWSAHLSPRRDLTADPRPLKRAELLRVSCGLLRIKRG